MFDNIQNTKQGDLQVLHNVCCNRAASENIEGELVEALTSERKQCFHVPTFNSTEHCLDLVHWSSATVDSNAASVNFITMVSPVWCKHIADAS